MTGSVRVIRAISTVVAAGLAAAGLLAVTLGIGLFVIVGELPRVPEPLRRIIETPTTEIFAANGETLYQVGGRDFVLLDQVAPAFLDAILATEDHRFWDHHGINKLRTVKALWITLTRPGAVQGASTITQQLAKNLFFSFEKTYLRKFRELLVAFQIEAQFSKQEILEAYVNQIYFGPRAQGVEAAARQFFGKTAAHLNLAEAALLAGLPQSPSRYNPRRHLERAKARQKVVLGRMVAAGFINDEQARQAADAPLQFQTDRPSMSIGGYFVDLVLKALEQRFGPQVVYHGGLKVTTTLDPQLQAWAEQAMVGGLDELEQMMGITASSAADGVENGAGPQVAQRPQGALASVQVNSGAIKALVGGRNYQQTEFNRAVSRNRQPGSGFKPFLYYTALDRLDMNPGTVMVDQPVRIPVAGQPDWVPRNFERRYQGPMILKRAFTQSVNTIAAQLVARTGPEAVIETARRCGLTGPLKSVFSVALGTSGVSPLDMAGAFATFATGGIHHEPFAIWRVEDARGNVLLEHIVSRSVALNPQVAFQVLDMMEGVIDTGSGRRIRQLGFTKTAAGKTGTTNGFKDAWFTGFTPVLSTSVWVGFDRSRGLKDKNGGGITGGRGAAPIWAAFMAKATEGDPPRQFNPPPGIFFEQRDPVSGNLAGPWTSSPVRVAMRPGTESRQPEH